MGPLSGGGPKSAIFLLSSYCLLDYTVKYLNDTLYIVISV